MNITLIKILGIDGGLFFSLFGFALALVGLFFDYFNKPSAERKIKILLVAVTGILISTASSFYQTYEVNEKDKKLEKSNLVRDSVIASKTNDGIKTNRVELFDDISKAFAKEGLKLDTLTQTVVRIEKVRPVKTVVNNFPQKDPFFTLDSIHIESKSASSQKISFHFKCYVATIVNVRIATLGRVIFKNGFHHYFFDTTGIASDKIIVQDAQIPLSIDLKTMIPIQSVSLYCKGIYTSFQGNRKYHINEVFDYEVDSRNFGYFISEMKTTSIADIVSGLSDKGIRVNIESFK